MKKLYCKDCLKEVIPNDNTPKPSVEDLVHKRYPNFDQLPDSLKKTIKQIGSRTDFTFSCALCKNRTSDENTILFDSDDPITSLKQFKVVKVVNQGGDDTNNIMSYGESSSHIIIKRGGYTTLLLGIIFTLVGGAPIANEVYSLARGFSFRTDQLIFLIFAIPGLIMLYFGLAKSHIKFYSDRIETYSGIINNQNKYKAFYRGHHTSVNKISTGKENDVKIYKLTINGETIARGLFRHEAEGIEKYLNFYLNTQSNTISDGGNDRYRQSSTNDYSSSSSVNKFY